MPDEMSGLLSQAALPLFLGLLLSVVCYRFTVAIGELQVGVIAGAEPSSGWQGREAAGAREQAQQWVGMFLPARGGHFPAGPDQPGPGDPRQVWPRMGSDFCRCHWDGGECLLLTHCFLCPCRKEDQRSTDAEARRDMPEVSSPWAMADAPHRHHPVPGCPIHSLTLFPLPTAFVLRKSSHPSRKQ